MSPLCTSLLLAVFAQEPEKIEPATYTIEGQVTDALGEPVPAADVWVTAADPSQEVLARGKTDGSGVFTIGHVPERPHWMVHAASPGRCEDAEYLSPRDTVARLRLFDAATVRGKWIDADGRPVAGAAVIAVFDVARVLHYTRATAVTGADGAFELTGVPLGVIDVRAWKRGVGLATARVHVQDDTEVELAPIEGRAAIEVRVTGLPAAGERPSVNVLPYADGSLQTLPDELVRGEVDADGVWRTQDLPAWEYQVLISATTFTFAPPNQKVNPTRPTTVTFDAHEIASIRLAGLLVDDHEKPLPGVRLALRASNSSVRSEAITAEDGSFQLESVVAPGSPCIVQSLDQRWVLDQRKDEGKNGSWDERFLGWHETKVDPDHPLALRAVAACSVTGRVRTAEGGAVPFASVELQTAAKNRSPLWMARAYARTDRTGRFRITGQHATELPARVSVQDAKGAVDGEAFELTAGADVALPDLELVPPAIVHGVVADDRGRPAPGARVWLRTWDFATGNEKDGSITEVITDRSGRYRFVGVAPGGYFVQAMLWERHPFEQARDPFELRPKETAKHDLQLQEQTR